VNAERVHFLTAEGREKLQKELKFLRNVRRPQVVANLKSAVEGGDLTENSGYDESKREQAFLEGRICDIEAILSTAQVLENDGNHDLVSLGARITVAEEGGEPETYRLVGRAEADPSKGRISNESPLGRALLGRHPGDVVRVDTPSGEVSFEILAIG
jgi:transcription elongation factor GreA